LLEDIPRLIAESGDAMSVAEFYEAAYNVTPAHTTPRCSAARSLSFTDAGGQRRKSNTISVTDTIKLKSQRSFFSILPDPDRTLAPGKLIK
jgi:hypothetical protein